MSPTSSPPSTGKILGQRLLLWTVSVAVILAAATLLYGVRDVLAANGLNLPDLGAPEPLPPPPTVVEIPSSDGLNPPEPELTYEDIQAMISPLPGQLLDFVDEGLEDLSDLAEMEKTTARKDRVTRFYDNWKRIWNNRLTNLRAAVPPPEKCAIHAALAPTCALVEGALVRLAEVSATNDIETGREKLAGIRVMIDNFLHPPAEEPPEDAPADGPQP